MDSIYDLCWPPYIIHERAPNELERDGWTWCLMTLDVGFRCVFPSTSITRQTFPSDLCVHSTTTVLRSVMMSTLASNPPDLQGIINCAPS